MKKNIFLFIGIVLTIMLVYWEYYLSYKIKGFNNISDWGSYFLIVPMIFCYVIFFLNPDRINPLSAISMVSLGVIVTILLSRDLSASFWLSKICATIAGGMVMWFIMKRLF